MAALARLANFRSLIRAPYWRQNNIALAYYGTGSAAEQRPTPREDTIPTDAEQATGLEKKELDALMAGVEDPFNLGLNTGPWGTRDKPTLVPSMFDERFVGCICEEDATYINWMKLKKGDSQRCECGHWFKLIEANPTKI